MSAFEQKYAVSSLFVNSAGRLGLYATLNILQDIAWKHAEHLGWGFSQMAQTQSIWVLTRQILKMSQWPEWGEEIQVKTWVRPPDGLYAYRDFELTNNRGQLIGLATTSWLVLDKTTRKPMRLDRLEQLRSVLGLEGNGLEAPKILLPEQMEALAEFKVRISDLDVNEHVNNTKYAQWILDSIPREKHLTKKLKSYAVNFIAETHLGDEVIIERQQSIEGQPNCGLVVYRGVRKSDGKVLFAAELDAEDQIETIPR